MHIKLDKHLKSLKEPNLTTTRHISFANQFPLLNIESEKQNN